MIEAYEARGVEVIHGWGMTETSPICTTGSVKAKHRDPSIRLKYQRRAGRIVYGVQMRIVDEDGNVQPDDGASEGELHVRGPWVAARVLRQRARDGGAVHRRRLVPHRRHRDARPATAT